MEHHRGLLISKGCGSHYVINTWMINIGKEGGEEGEKEGGTERGEMKERVSCDRIFLSPNCISFPKASSHSLHNLPTPASALNL